MPWLLATFAIFALAFFVRPLGALIWGPLGDRIGRKRTLVIVASLMGAGTFAIGLLPTYAEIGILAPVLLLVARLLQGLSAGGELSGASTYIGEFAPQNRRGLHTSWLQVATTVAFLPGLAIVEALTLTLSAEAMSAWGWRVPFLLAGPLALIGLYMRMKLEDTPRFQAITESGEKAQAPLAEAFRTPGTYKQMALVVLFGASSFVGFYFVLTYLPSLLTEELGYTPAMAVLVVASFTVVSVAVIPVMGLLSDVYGRRPVLIFSSVGFLVLVHPTMLLLQNESVMLAVLAGILLAIPISAAQGMQLAASLERFPTRIRYTGYGTGFAILAAIFGGTTPYVSTWLVSTTGSVLAPGFYLMAAAVISLVAGLVMSETSHRPLPDV